MIKLKFTSLFKYAYVYLILLVILILTIHYPYLVIVLLFYIYQIRKHISWVILISIALIYLLGFFTLQPKEKDVSQDFIISHVENKENYYQYTVTSGLNSYHFSSQVKYEFGDIIFIKGKTENYRKQTVPGGFNSFRYQLGKGIKGIIRMDTISLKSPSPFRSFMLKPIPILDLFYDDALIETQYMSHLFKLSSIHLTFLITLIFKLFYYLDIKDTSKYLITALLMGISFLIGFSVIILRMCIKYSIKYLNNQHNLDMDNFNIEVITCLIILIFNPYIIYNHTFIVVYVFVFYIALSSSVAKKRMSYIIPFLIAPFLLLWQKEISIISLFFIPIMSLLIKYVWVPSLIIGSILPFISLIDSIALFIQKLEAFIAIYDVRFYLMQLSGIMWIIYFGFILFLCAAPHKRAFYRRFSVLLGIVVISFILTFKPLEDSVIFLDVGQGDSAVIFKDNQVIVVYAFANVTSYLKYHYVYTIDYLIITHADFDHMKEVDDLLLNFNIKTIVVSGYMDYPVKHPNIYRVREGKLKLPNSLGIKLLGPTKDYLNINDNSVVFKIHVDGLNYLFAGDIGIQTEKDLVQMYGRFLKSDVLKVPHHGSNTSSSMDFLYHVDPSIAVVSVSKRNVYNLPNNEIIQIYRDYGLYLHQTKDSGSLIIKKKNLINFPP
ncbi:hypothetical protein BHS12_03920 [Acholeplasma laidlawii]|nr:hypothetical protein BHS12_03920 [Acholeplasma laidlawii]